MIEYEICLRAILFHSVILIVSVREEVEISTPRTILDISRYTELTNVSLKDSGNFILTFENHECEDEFLTEVRIHHSMMSHIVKLVLNQYQYLVIENTDS